MQLWNKVAAFLDRTISIFAILAGAVIIFMMLSVSAEVVMRYFLNRPIVWMVEVNEYALLWATFLGTAWVLKKEQHIIVEVLVERLRPKARAMLGFITSIVGAIICAVLVWYSAQTTCDHWVRGVWNPASLLETPTAYVLAIIPIAGFLLVFQFLRRTSGYLERWRASSNKQ